MCKYMKLQIAKSMLINKHNIEDIFTHGFKLYHRTTVPKTEWHWNQETEINGIELRT